MANKDFFISFTQSDAAWAEWIAWTLEEAGYTVVFQEWDFRPGTNFVVEMDEATKTTERTIAVVSPEYLRSRFVKAEWAERFSQDPDGRLQHLIPVKVAECVIRGLLGTIVCIDLTSCPPRREIAKERLLSGISRHRKKPGREPDLPNRSTTPGVVRWQAMTAADIGILRKEKPAHFLFLSMILKDSYLPCSARRHLLVRADETNECKLDFVTMDSSNIFGKLDNFCLLGRLHMPLPPGTPVGTIINLEVSVDINGHIELVANCRGQETRIQFSIEPRPA